ncbi:MAG: hypothetical protein KatS3mg008_0507 [Acidimicrobiales bacterium]|nr:MAG: hypothetical protein KatS3mg008_0507 [Acidimicrobiales bacterium]
MCSSAAATLWAWSGREDHKTSFVVAAKSIPPGAVLTESSLTTMEMSLPPQVARLAYTDPHVLIGAVAKDGIRRGELLQAPHLVRPADRRSGGRELSFSVERSRALGGSVYPGEIVDVIASVEGDDGESGATWVSRRARVVAVQHSDDLSNAAEFTITVSVRDDRVALELAGAVESGRVRLVRRVGETAGDGQA